MNIELTPKAKKRQFEIILYSKEHFGINITLHFIEKIEHTISLLINNPYMGTIEPLLAHRKEGFRYIPIHPYKMIYYIDESDETIYIVTFFNTWQQPDKLLEVIR